MLRHLTSLIVLGAGVTLLSACSSTPTPNPDPMQYCYTESEYNLKNGNVSSSEVTVECSDEPSKRAKFVGVDPKTCRSWNKQIVVGGRTKEVYGFLCKDENGNFRPLDQF